MKQYWEVVKSTNGSMLSRALVENIERVARNESRDPAGLVKRLTRAFDD
jgi:hypothetical protein